MLACDANSASSNHLPFWHECVFSVHLFSHMPYHKIIRILRVLDLSYNPLLSLWCFSNTTYLCLNHSLYFSASDFCLLSNRQVFSLSNTGCLLKFSSTPDPFTHCLPVTDINLVYKNLCSPYAKCLARSLPAQRDVQKTWVFTRQIFIIIMFGFVGHSVYPEQNIKSEMLPFDV